MLWMFGLLRKDNKTVVKKALAFVIIPALLCSTASQASDWRHWRGPFFNGSTDETNLPSRFSQTENVAWVSPLPGHSSATPIICKQRVFVSSTDRDSADLFALKSGGNWELSEDYVAWKFDGPTPDVCTPLYYKVFHKMDQFQIGQLVLPYLDLDLCYLCHPIYITPFLIITIF